MVTLDELRQSQKKRKERQPLPGPDRLTRLSWIMKMQDPDLEMISGESYKPDFRQPSRHTKGETGIPPYCLVGKRHLDKAREVMQAVDNPYIDFAASFDEVELSSQLYSLNPALTAEQLTNMHFKDLIGLEIANIELAQVQEKIRTLEETLETSDEKMLLNDLAARLGADTNVPSRRLMETIYEAAVIDDVKEHFKAEGRTLEEVTQYLVDNFQNSYQEVSFSDISKGDMLKVVTDSGEHEGKLTCKCSGTVELDNGRCRKYKELYKTSGEDYKKILGIPIGRVSERKLRKIISKRISEYLTQSESELDDSRLEDYIGAKVKLYPAGNRSGRGTYDMGGNKSEVPPGTAGVIREAKEGKLLVGFESRNLGIYKDEIEGPGWHIKPREAYLIGAHHGLCRRFSISEDTAKAILEKDYHRMMRCYREDLNADSLKRLGGLKETETQFKDYIRAIEGRE